MRITAEISASHDGSMEKALKLVEEAAFAGADYVKFQTFEPDLLVGNDKYVIKSGPWEGRKLIDLYKEAHTPKEWHKDLFEHARDLHLEPFSTPFHQSDVDFLETLNCPIYKIASFEIINTDLVKYAASTGKPIILSTGMASYDEVLNAMLAIHQGGGSEVTLLHCISQYPTDMEKVNLNSLETLAELSDYGVSDHSQSPLVAVAATVMGASMVEKHICMDREGVDKFASLPHQFRDMVEQVRTTEALLGKDVFKSIRQGEKESQQLRPSLYWSQDVPRGTVIKEHHLKVARPSEGAPPFYKYQIVGTKTKYNVKKGTPVVQVH